MTLLEAALAWHESNITIVPASTNGTKAPAIPWKLYQATRPTTAQLEQWFAGDTYDGLGAITGAASGGLELFEFEGRATHLVAEMAAAMADNGFQELWHRITAHGYVETTPSGGIHILYRVDGPPAHNTKLARVPRDGGGVDVLIETRGEGGFTITAPSAGRTHPTGKAWTTVAGTPATIPTISVDDRDALFAIAGLFDQMPVRDLPPSTPNVASHAPDGSLRPGDDYNARTTWDEILTPHGWTKTKRLGAGYGWTRPGKSAADGISATTGTAADGVDRLYVFSSSTEFDTEVPYSKFAAYALLEHAGDLSAAAKQLAKDGYGTPATRLSPDPLLEGLPTEGNTPWPPTSAAPATPPSTANTDGPGAPPSDASSASGATDKPPTNLAPRDAKPNEDNTALLLIDQHHNEIRYCPGRGKWLTWNGHRWVNDDNGHVRELVRAIARRLPDGTGWDTYKKRAQSNNGVTGILGLAATDARIVAPADQLDARPYELNTPAGVINLKTGTLTAPDPAALHTRSTAIHPDFEAAAPMWEKFLADTFAGDPSMTAYVQRLLGLSLVGCVLEQVFPFAFGLGANGKTTLLSVALKLAGTGASGYAMSAPATMLLATKNDAHPTELARLSGARLVVTSELEDNQRFAEAKIKLLTGKDTITGRFMRQDWFDFTPTHTLWLLANHQPEVRAGGEAFWRRVRMLPFMHTVPEDQRIADLEDRLIEDEGPAILAWMIRGAAEYFQHGLKQPLAVIVATQDYQRDQDSLARFIDDMCEVGPINDPTMAVPSHELRTAYVRWCATEGEEALSQRAMVNALKNRFHVVPTRTMTLRQLSGIRLAPTTEKPAPDASSDASFLGGLDGVDKSDRGGW